MNSKTLNASKVIFAAMLAGGLLLLGCRGDDGAVGPMGNANVIYSEWVTGALLKDSIVDGSNIKVAHIKAPEITVDVLTTGTVFMFMNYGAGPMPLPYTSFAGGKANTISFYPRVGQVIPYRFTHDNTNSVNLPSQLQYRYVIIPADTTNKGNATGRIAAKESVDYEAFCKKYGIPL